VLRDQGSASEDVGMQLMEYVKSRKVAYKRVREIEFVDAVPKSATGKLLRRVLKGWERGENPGRMKGVVVRELERERPKL